MNKYYEIYKCDLCGNMVDLIHPGGGELSCCNQPMKCLDEKTADQSTEKHVPVIEKVEGGYKVVVGSTLHPMTDDHYIQWIEVLDSHGWIIQRKHLKPGDAPEVIFKTDAEITSAREYCNLHGLWTKKA